MGEGWLRIFSVRALIFVLFCPLLGCAGAGDPAHNAINNVLNNGGQQVTGSISKFERQSIREIAGTGPVCIAYQLPDKAPFLTSKLSQTLSDIASGLRKNENIPMVMTVFHAKRAGGVDPLGELIQIEKQLPGFYSNARMDFYPLRPKDFRKKAHCNGKDSILVSGDDIQFYRSELPLATTTHGEISIDTVLFFVLETGSRAQLTETIEQRRHLQ